MKMHSASAKLRWIQHGVLLIGLLSIAILLLCPPWIEKFPRGIPIDENITRGYIEKGHAWIWTPPPVRSYADPFKVKRIMEENEAANERQRTRQQATEVERWNESEKPNHAKWVPKKTAWEISHAGESIFAEEIQRDRERAERVAQAKQEALRRFTPLQSTVMIFSDRLFFLCISVITTISVLFALSLSWHFIASCIGTRIKATVHLIKINKIATARIVIIVLVFALLSSFTIFVWPTRYRYTHSNMGGRVVLVRIDRFTNVTEVLWTNGWSRPSKNNILAGKRSRLHNVTTW